MQRERTKSEESGRENFDMRSSSRRGEEEVKRGEFKSSGGGEGK